MGEGYTSTTLHNLVRMDLKKDFPPEHVAAQRIFSFEGGGAGEGRVQVGGGSPPPRQEAKFINSVFLCTTALTHMEALPCTHKGVLSLEDRKLRAPSHTRRPTEFIRGDYPCTTALPVFTCASWHSPKGKAKSGTKKTSTARAQGQWGTCGSVTYDHMSRCAI